MAFATRLALGLMFAGLLTAQRTPEEAQRALNDGNRRFAADRSVAQPIGEGVRRTLARGQSPIAVVLTCADSQVPPEHVFNQGLGELFVVRIGGHVADPETIASVEYAIEQLAVPLCVVLAHEGCGTIQQGIAHTSETASQRAPSPAMQALLERIEPAIRKARGRDLGGAELQTACEEEHAHQVVHELLRRSQLLQRHQSVGRCKILPARFHQESGEVEWLPVRPLPQPPKEASHEPLTGVPMGVPPHVALRLLQAGHRRFLGDGRPTIDLGKVRREQLAHGQQPLAIVLTCADARTPPEHIFDAGLGELFVIRLAGHALNDNALATIEYAAGTLGASLLVVMGHTQCTAFASSATAPGSQLSPNQQALLLRLEPALAQTRGQGRDAAEQAMRAHVQRTVADARNRSPLLQKLEQAGRFTALASVYDLQTGDLEWLKEQSSESAAKHGAAADPAHGHGEAQAAGHGAGHEHDGHHGQGHDNGHTTPANKAAGTASAHGSTPHHGGDDAHTAPGDHHGDGSKPHAAVTAPAPGTHQPHGEAAPGHHGDQAHGAPATKGANPEGDAMSTSLFEWAAAPAPGGESQMHGKDHSTAAHPPASGAAKPAKHTGAAAPPHHDAPGPDGHGAAGHGTDGHAAAGHAPDAHGTHGQPANDPHDHSTQAAATTAGHGHPAAPLTWRDPMVLVGLGGVLSLLLAALLAIKN